MNLPKLKLQSGEHLLNQVIFDDSAEGEVITTFVFKGNRTLPATDSPDLGILFNDTQWHRNLTMDEVVSRTLYFQQKRNAELEFTPLLVSNNTMQELEELMTQMEQSHAAYIAEVSRLKVDSGSFMD